MERIVAEVGEEKVKDFFALYEELRKAMNKVIDQIDAEKKAAK